MPGSAHLSAGAHPLGRPGLRQHEGRAQGLRAALLPARARAALTPADPSACDRARLLAVRGSLAEALAELDAVLAAEPDHVPALLLKAGVLVQDREPEAALPLYERAARLAPRSAEALNELARCLHVLGRHEEALELARTALDVLGEGENFRHTAPVYLTLVWCLRELRRYREALALAEQGLERTPDAILAQWASFVEEELAESEKEEC